MKKKLKVPIISTISFLIIFLIFFKIIENIKLIEGAFHYQYLILAINSNVMIKYKMKLKYCAK